MLPVSLGRNKVYICFGRFVAYTSRNQRLSTLRLHCVYRLQSGQCGHSVDIMWTPCGRIYSSVDTVWTLCISSRLPLVLWIATIALLLYTLLKDTCE